MEKSKITIRDVAKAANVSVASVSYVLNGVDRVSKETKDKVLSAVESLGYKPNITARKLAKREKSLIGIIMPISESYKKTILTDNPFYQEFISGVEYCARKNGFNIVIMSVDGDNDGLNNVDQNSLLGIIVVGYIENDLCKTINELDIPIILIDQKKEDFNFITLTSDDEVGGYKATEYLINQGHKKIGFLSGEIDGCYVHKRRFDGYVKALKANNIAFDDTLIFNSAVSYEGGIESSAQVYEKIHDITAVFCISDIMVLGLMKGLMKRGVSIPDEVSIIGFDDIKPSRYFNPELTTVRQDIFLKGEKAVELLINKEEIDKELYVLPVELIERESVKTI